MENHKNITIFSFGYQFGKPADADLVISVRHFAAPSKECRKLNGTHKRLQQELYAYPEFGPMYTAVLETINIFFDDNKKNEYTIKFR